MRGEHQIRGGSENARVGSSPHARGAQSTGRTHNLTTRIIPACAGSTRRPACRPASPGDHPRMRGEHPCRRSSMSALPGSSPHARGAPRHQGRALPRGGIIPACAGSTRSLPTRRLPSWDHPRMRGEHEWVPLEAFTAEGSSPHARGARSSQSPGPDSLRDHPRMRGEHSQSMETLTMR